MWRFAPRAPRLFELQMRVVPWMATRLPWLYVTLALWEFGPVDRDTYRALHLGTRLRPTREEAFRQNGIGSWYDAMVPANWPVPLDAIATRVRLWQGQADESVPPAMGRFLASKIPNCEATFIEGAGHLWIVEHLGEVLEDLVRPA
jgi:pimeloyl-ACP methyl ester carboxylesterase